MMDGGGFTVLRRKPILDQTGNVLKTIIMAAAPFTVKVPLLYCNNQ